MQAKKTAIMVWAWLGLTAASAAAAAERTRASLQTGWDKGHWRIAASPFTHHFRHNPEHRRVWAVAVERQREDDWLAGVSLFRNSFGQPSSYTYLGRRFDDLLGQPQLFGQVTGGILYGYRGQWKNKVPLNFNGFSPGAVVSAGWQFTPRQALTAHLLGDAGIMLQWSMDLR